MRSPLERLSLAHGIFNFTTGLWPVLHRKSFEAVTGPKTDFWLVNTVGLLLSTTGAVMTVAGIRRSVTPEVKVLAIGITGTLAAIDVIYVSKRRIAPVYLMDALTEAALAASWTFLSKA
jgi:hypothetical protein